MCLWMDGRESSHMGNPEAGAGPQDLGTKQRKAWPLDEHHRWQSKWAIRERDLIEVVQWSHDSWAVCQVSCQKGRQWSRFLLGCHHVVIWLSSLSSFAFSVLVFFLFLFGFVLFYILLLTVLQNLPGLSEAHLWFASHVPQGSATYNFWGCEGRREVLVLFLPKIKTDGIG